MATRAALGYLNSPPVKEGIKNTIGVISFSGGVIAVASSLTRAKIQQPQSGPDRILLLLMRVSVILSGLMSRPGLRITAWVLQKITTPEKLTKIFGENANFETNPKHLRHRANIAANLLSVVGFISLFHQRVAHIPPTNEVRFLRALTIFNFLTGRSTLHLANNAFHAALKMKRA